METFPVGIRKNKSECPICYEYPCGNKWLPLFLNFQFVNMLKIITVLVFYDFETTGLNTNKDRMIKDWKKNHGIMDRAEWSYKNCLEIFIRNRILELLLWRTKMSEYSIGIEYWSKLLWRTKMSREAVRRNIVAKLWRTKIVFMGSQKAAMDWGYPQYVSKLLIPFLEPLETGLNEEINN